MTSVAFTRKPSNTMVGLQIEGTPTKPKKVTFVPCDGVKPAKSSRGSTLTIARSGNLKVSRA